MLGHSETQKPDPKKLTYTKRAKIAYGVAAAMFVVSLGLHIAGMFRLGYLFGSLAIGTAIGTATVNGHLTTRKKVREQDESKEIHGT
ncbi:MAG: hypothetical protein HZA90_00150 [Verrucomicrobia bacterium]|nr:hypothetical protein [Verrucomicrobiota bacterium]